MNFYKKILIFISFLSCCWMVPDYALATQPTKFYEYSNAKGITVINYHAFGDHPQIAHINTSKARFREQLIMLKQNGYTSISESELVAYLQGHGRIPEKSVYLTIDDGYESVYTVAYPILKELGMQATLFVIVKEIELGSRKGVPMLNWSQIKEMADSNVMKIGNHTYDLHWRGNNDSPTYEAMLLNQTKEGKQLTNEARQQLIVEDVLKAKQLIEQHTSKQTTSFAYPYGAYDKFAEQAIKQAGYSIDYSTESGTNLFGSGTVHIKRIDSSNRVSALALKKIVEEHQAHAAQLYKNRDIQVEAQVTQEEVTVNAWLKSDSKSKNLKAKEARFELYKTVNGERQIVRNFGAYCVPISGDSYMIKTSEKLADYEAGSYSIKSIIVKKDGSKEVFWVNFSR